ncbi:MAG: LOG family protein [Candidatus Kapabacteria bacterium]|nr:LOG family protein [Candidatus Kapabacteria bacterium]MCS7170182.1 LOG family protein [Candidatus Kapabacteria bacterium]MDW8225709.1 LOG family protein [Bacteroidota bacterium]
MENKLPTGQRSPKAYDNAEFLHSRDARVLRILAEYLYPEQRFRKLRVRNTVVFWGSARCLSEEEFQHQWNALQAQREWHSERDEELLSRQQELERIRPLTRYYEEARLLARMLTEWSLTLPPTRRFVVCSGGGPGIMEAANRGAYEAGGISIGLGISLPYEQSPNPYITPELNFAFHYFFMRKFWFVYLAKAMVLFPGGFGTMDELMEVLTLVQTRKIRRRLPVVLYGEDFWQKAINFDYMAERGVIAPEDLRLFVYVNTPRQAFEYLHEHLRTVHGLGAPYEEAP